MMGTALRDVAGLEAYQLCESTPRCLVEAIAAGIAILAQCDVVLGQSEVPLNFVEPLSNPSSDGPPSE